MTSSVLSTLPVVHSYDEWSTLREVIVGRADHLTEIQLDNSFSVMHWGNVRSYLAANNYFRDASGVPQWPTVQIDPWVVDETIEDLEDFAAALGRAGVVVRRPADVVGDREVCTPFWRSTQSPPLNVRDQMLVLGTALIETAPHVRARLFENDYLKPLLYEYFERGAEWCCMPRPTLAAGSLDVDRADIADEAARDTTADHHALGLGGLPKEMVFDGAQCLRLGVDVLVNVGNRNHELGLRWLERMFGERFRFHRLARVGPDHIDSFLLPLRPGLWLVRHRDVLNCLPEPFASWDYVVAPPVTADQFPSYEGTGFPIASRHIDMNVLSIDQSTVAVNSLYPELARALEARGLDVMLVRLRHRRLIGGGFHCLSLDVVREGGLEDYA